MTINLNYASLRSFLLFALLVFTFTSKASDFDDFEERTKLDNNLSTYLKVLQQDLLISEKCHKLVGSLIQGKEMRSPGPADLKAFSEPDGFRIVSGQFVFPSPPTQNIRLFTLSLTFKTKKAMPGPDRSRPLKVFMKIDQNTQAVLGCAAKNDIK